MNTKLCTKCKTNERSGTSSLCNPCRAEAARVRRAGKVDVVEKEVIEPVIEQPPVMEPKKDDRFAELFHTDPESDKCFKCGAVARRKTYVYLNETFGGFATMLPSCRACG